MQLRLRDRAGVQTGMRRWDRLILQPLEHVYWNTARQPRTQVVWRFELIARPTAHTDEGRGDQHDHP